MLKPAVITGAIGVVVAIAGALTAADNHWARASDVAALSRSIDVQANYIAKQIEIGRLSAEANTLAQRRATIMDKIQDSAARRYRTAVDDAILERYKADLKYVEINLRDKERQIDQLRKP